MRMPPQRAWELYVGLRYTRAKRRNHFISFISVISMGGIALGVTALIVVLSVMNGFERELRERILGMASHASISGYQQPLQNWPEAARLALQNSDLGIVGAAPYIEGEGMLRRGSQLSGTLLRGILPDEESQVSDVGEHMVEGSLNTLQAGGYGIVLGSELALVLGVGSGDKVDLMIPQTTVTPAGIVPRFRRFTVVGTFEVGMYEYDRSLVLLHMQDAQTLYGMGNDVSGVRLKLEDMFRAPRVSRELAAALPGSFYVTDWTRQHANFFRAIATEKTVMFIILTLIVAVAAFNIVSTLVMVVTDKEADIAILRTLGATPKSIMGVFMVQGSLIGFIGTAVGVSLGILLAVNVENIVPFVERMLGQDFLPGDVYYISQLKGEIHWPDVTKIAVVSLILGLISTLYPAYRASRVQPAEALRYE